VTLSSFMCLAEGSSTARSSIAVVVAESVHVAPKLSSTHLPGHSTTKEQVPERTQERTYLLLSHSYLVTVSKLLIHDIGGKVR
jgi:hypothetical protein